MSEKQQQSLKTVKRYMWWSMGAGLVPLPILDLVAVSGVQVKMLADVSNIYDLSFKKSRVRAVIGSLVGFVVLGVLLVVLAPLAAFPQVIPQGGHSESYCAKLCDHRKEEYAKCDKVYETRGGKGYHDKILRAECYRGAEESYRVCQKECTAPPKCGPPNNPKHLPVCQ